MGVPKLFLFPDHTLEPVDDLVEFLKEVEGKTVTVTYEAEGCNDNSACITFVAE